MKNRQIFPIILFVSAVVVAAGGVAEASAWVEPYFRNAGVGDRLNFTANSEREDIVVTEWYVRIVGGGEPGSFPGSGLRFSFTVGEALRGETLTVYFRYYIRGFEDTTTTDSRSATVRVRTDDDDGSGCVSINCAWPMGLLALARLFVIKRRSRPRLNK